MGDAVRRTIMTVAETFRRKRERADPGCVRRSQELAISFHRCRAGSVRLLSIERTIRLGFRICYGHRTIKTGMFSRLPPPPRPQNGTRVLYGILLRVPRWGAVAAAAENPLMGASRTRKSRRLYYLPRGAPRDDSRPTRRISAAQ